MNYQEMIDYVEKVLKESGRDNSVRHPFRSRFSHTKRVLSWAIRLSEGRTDVDREVLFTAVIFHDIGYSVCDDENHEHVGKNLFLEYSKAHGFSEDFSNKVAKCINSHSDKWLMKTPDKLTVEQILLMEADALDEEGAMSVLWDNLASGYDKVDSFYSAYEHTLAVYERKKHKAPCVTEKGVELWNKKMKFLEEYINELSIDLSELPII